MRTSEWGVDGSMERVTNVTLGAGGWAASAQNLVTLSAHTHAHTHTRARADVDTQLHVDVTSKGHRWALGGQSRKKRSTACILRDTMLL